MLNKLLGHEKIRTREITTEFILRGKDGNIKPLWNENFLGRLIKVRISLVTGSFGSVMKTHNLITNVGHAAANGRMSNQGAYSPFVNIAIGTGTVAAAAADTTLGTEITTSGGGRGAATATQVTTTLTNDTTQLVKTFTFTATFAVTEEGILDSATTGGSLLARQVFTAINVVSGDSLQITHKYST
jgi:hypothetical protein